MPAATKDRSEVVTPRAMTTHEKEIVSSLYLHRLLTTSQLHALHDPTKHVRCTQRRLEKLKGRGFVANAQGPGPAREYRWWLTERGAQLAELGGDVEIRKFRMTADAATGRHADHLMAVNDIGLALVRAAGEHGDEFGYHHWRHEIAHRYGRGNNDVLSADAVVTYDVRTRDGAVVSERRFLEVDRGTESVHALAEKVYAYQLFARWEPPRRDTETHLPKLALAAHLPLVPGCRVRLCRLVAGTGQGAQQRPGQLPSPRQPSCVGHDRRRCGRHHLGRPSATTVRLRRSVSCCPHKKSSRCSAADERPSLA